VHDTQCLRALHQVPLRQLLIFSLLVKLTSTLSPESPLQMQIAVQVAVPVRRNLLLQPTRLRSFYRASLNQRVLAFRQVFEHLGLQVGDDPVVDGVAFDAQLFDGESCVAPGLARCLLGFLLRLID
jgi:hypothetical protein